MSKDPNTEDKLPENLRRALKTVVEHFDKEDRLVRERQLRFWKKMKFYWAGFSRLWWSEVAHDWRVFDIHQSTNLNDASFYDKPINVFRAYMESIIAALSISIPSIKCIPDNIDEPNDLLTAKGGDKISELVYKHNDAPLLWMRALWVYCTEGMIAAYTYPKEDEKYGTYAKNEFKNQEVTKQVFMCPNCGADLAEDEFMPEDGFCSQCDSQVNDPQQEQRTFIVRRLVGITQEPKSRQCIEVYGGLNIKIPNYARNQDEVPALIYTYETHYSYAVEKYPWLKDIYREGGGSGGIYDPYERWARLSTQYFGEYPNNNGTWRLCWLRPCSFYVLADESEIRELRKRFPDGAKVTFWNDQYCESENEALDDCWTIAKNPLSDYVHYDPAGSSITSVQEIINDIISLVLQTIEHGIPQTFADPTVLNFEQYRQTEVAPGTVFPAKAKAGKGLSDSFYEVRTATLSQEVQPFGEKIQELGQFVSGALPSLFGGAQESGSKTAAQYAMSRAQALQRLQIQWKMFTYWWKNIFGKVIPSYIKTMQEEEHYTKEDSLGNFVTIMIRRAELQGKLGSVELEASEQLPLTQAQVKDVIMQLFASPNPEIMQALTYPENIPLIADAIGLTNFELPGENDRTKQYEEISQLVNSAPIPGPQGQEFPSVDVDVLIDNHAEEAAICRRWLVGETGRQAKIDKPQGYRNVLLHLQHHMQVMQQQQQQQAPQQAQQNPQGAAPPAKPPADNPTEGDGNANTVH